MDVLDSVLASLQGKPKQDSSKQLEQMQAAQKAGTPEQEKAARAAGFKTHVEYMAWLRQRENKTGGSVSGGKNPGKAKASVKTATAIHPRNLLDYVNDAIRGATKKDD